MERSSENRSNELAQAASSTAPLGALRAVLAAAERLGVGPNQLLAAAELEAAALGDDDRAALELLKSVPRQPSAGSFVDAVRATTASLIAAGRCSVEDVAKKLAVSPRTLQRRLERSGTTFGEVCDETRRTAALAHLRNPNIAIKEAAFLLGFSEPSTFHRAFRRWTGNTPASYRRALAN